MKILVVILAALSVVVYFGFFAKFVQIYKDLGSSKTKIVVYFAGIESSEIDENEVSKFLLSHGVVYPEKWVLTHFYRGGLIKERLFTDGTSNSLDRIIPLTNNWLDRKLNVDKASEVEIEKNIKPFIIKFINCIQHGGVAEYDEIVSFIIEDDSKSFSESLKNKVKADFPKDLPQ